MQPRPPKSPLPSRITQRPDAVLFDWDNTLLDHDHMVNHFSEQLVREMGTPPYPTPEEMNIQWAKDHNEFFRKFFPDANEADVRARFRAFMDDVPVERAALFDGVRELLDSLRDKGVRMAVVSNKPQHLLEREVKKLGLEGYFEVLHGETAGVPLKPDPAPIIHTLKRMKLPLGKIWFVGDMPDDAGAARSDGIQRFLVRERHRDKIQNHIIGHDPLGGVVYLNHTADMQPYADAIPPRMKGAML